jgi:glycosyltransferase involved in cell wall biosynthesis
MAEIERRGPVDKHDEDASRGPYMSSANLSDPIVVNARITLVKSNGQRRVATEIMDRLENIRSVSPGAAYSSGIAGHLWEQLVLPNIARNKRLWSPSTSGPVNHPNHIVTIHDIAFEDGPQWFSKSFSNAYRFIAKMLTQNARHIISVSDFTTNRIIDHYGINPSRISTIHSGRSRSFYPRSDIEVSECIYKYSINTPKYIMAFRGSDPRKNFAAIHHAWKELRPDETESTLVTFGRTSNARVFESLKIESNNAANYIHLGELSDHDLACLFTGAAGFLFPSLYEGFGLPIIEAEACGCRVVTSNLSAMPEVSSSDAILIDPYSLSDIKCSIGKILSDNAQPIDRRARIASAERFDWDISAKQYQAVFERAFD